MPGTLKGRKEGGRRKRLLRRNLKRQQMRVNEVMRREKQDATHYCNKRDEKKRNREKNNTD